MSLQDAATVRRQAARARALALTTVSTAKTGHIGADLSAMDILCALYFGVLRGEADEADRDRFILSKAHASAAMYSVLALKGLLPEEELATFGGANSRLSTVVSTRVPGIEFNTGSLGHGLSLGVGSALGARIQGSTRRTFVLTGDGELQEGSNWEAAMLAASRNLDSLVAVVDRNLAQKGASTEDINALEPLDDKWRSFGWEVRTVDGHDIDALLDVFRSAPLTPGKPTCVIASTVKGKGVSFMERNLEWHSRQITPELLQQALQELEEVSND
ncbi:transketolase [Streptomyces sp. NPDC001523]|uniref:transketolase n=1 Tax=Streptomyces sp. NPDC001523 TaxID=3154383 RepID=UPI00331B92C5